MNLENLAERIYKTDSPESLLALGADLARSLGFDFFTLGYKYYSNFSTPETYYISNYPDAWQKEYDQKQYSKTDPTIYTAIRTQKPVVLDQYLFSNASDIWEGANKHNINFGWALAVGNLTGQMGWLVLARSEGELSEHEQTQKYPLFSALALLMFDRLMQLTALTQASQDPVRKIQLTSREIEVLKLTADGKTSADIAFELQISERTVNFHINNIMLRFNVPNKTSAVAKATLSGLLT